MKKLFLLIIIIFLCACQKSVDKQLLELGYAQEDVDIIMSYSEEIQEDFLLEYNGDYIELMHTYGFNIDNLDEYLKYYGFFDNEKIIELVNNNVINDSNKNKLKEMYEDTYYLSNNEYLYIEYLEKFNDVREVLEFVNTKRYFEDYTNVKSTDTSKDTLMLINKYYALDKNYVPDNLVAVEAGYGRGYTRADVYEAYKKMQNDANAAGYYFVITSAYRSYDVQYGLYTKNLETDPENCDTYSARPGHSEHQSGLCLDLATGGYGMDNFGLSPASPWVNENCYKYGFIIRYTKEKENITGYMAEPWQVRYVGDSDIAKFIMDEGITFDEYYACFVENE